MGIPALLALFAWMMGVLGSLPLLAGQILFWLAVCAMFAYALLPFFLRYRARKAIGLRYKGLKISPITWLAIVLLLLAIGYVVWFGNQL